MIAGNPPCQHAVGRCVRAGALAVSTIVHGTALVLIVRILPDIPAPEPRPRSTPVRIPPADPIEVEVLAADAAPARSQAAPGGTTGALRRAHGPEHATSQRETAGGPQVGRGRTENALRMRGPELALPPEVAERIAAEGAPAAGKAAESGRLKSAPGGGAVIDDRVTTVTVERDGTAHFADKPYIDPHWQTPIPHLDLKQDLHELGDVLQDWYADPYRMTRVGTRSELSEANHAMPGSCDSWGDPLCDDPAASDAEQRAKRHAYTTVGVGGGADVSAWLMRKYGHFDPFASRKRELLDDTRAEREERGEQFRAEQAAHSAELMQRNLEQLWAHVTEPAARRQALYELWSDCADDDAGSRARAMVIGWIRARLPPGSAGAFTADELARLAPFSPYEQ